MINFTLPNYYSNYQINLKLIKMYYQHSNWFKAPVHFLYVSGRVPYQFSGGGKNDNILFENAAYLNNNFENILKDYHNYNCNLQIDFSNYYLTQEDIIDNIFLQSLLKQIYQSSNIIEISDLSIKNYIETIDNNIYFCFGKNNIKITELEEINKILQEEKIIKFTIPTIFNSDYDFLKQIQNKNKCELIVNSICDFSCPDYYKCILKENLNIYNYSNKSEYHNCPIAAHAGYHEGFISFEDIINIYYPKGFKNFTFDDSFNYKTQFYLIDFYLKYFIKQEYLKLAQEFFDYD